MRPLSILCLLLPLPAGAWNDHSLLTRAALSDVAGLDSPVVVETLDAFVKATGTAGSEREFLAARKLNQAAGFPFSLGETVGSTVSLRRVVERYSDEPDWAIDDNLFDQYPELWKDDYRYMGGGKGSLSRVFRHLYWPGGFYREPKPPATEPVLDPTVLGEAPERCQLFFDLAKRAFAAGHAYWGARFLAWSLHYLEDMTQPFHAVQLPALEFLRQNPDGSLDLEGTTRLVIYHHLAIDNYPTRALEGSVGKDSAGRVGAALHGTDASAFPGARQLSEEAAKSSRRQAGKLGNRSLDFFPEMTEQDGKAPVDRIFNPRFWQDVTQRQNQYPDETEAFVGILLTALKPVGPDVRSLVLEAAGAGPVPTPTTRLPGDAAWLVRRISEFPAR